MLKHPNGPGSTGNLPFPLTPITLPAGRAATEVAAGGAHTCALLDNGQVTCWGYDNFGQLGNGAPTGDVSAPPAPITLPAGHTATAITAGDSHTCAIRRR